MRTLYEINADIRRLWDEAPRDEDGLVEINQEWLHDLEMEKEAKIEGVALLRKEKEAMAKAIKDEIDTLNKRLASYGKEIDSLDNYLRQATAEEKFETAKVKIAFRRSTRLIVDDESKVPENWQKAKITMSLDREGMKKAISKDGISIPGVHIEEYNNMSIK